MEPAFGLKDGGLGRVQDINRMGQIGRRCAASSRGNRQQQAISSGQRCTFNGQRWIDSTLWVAQPQEGCHILPKRIQHKVSHKVEELSQISGIL